MRRLLTFWSPFTVAAILCACSPLSQSVEDVIRFSHNVHSEQDLECDECHSLSSARNDLTDISVPAKPECGGCHDVEDRETCKTCHRDKDATSGTLSRSTDENLIFSHQKHETSGTKCADCHGGAAQWADFVSNPAPTLGHDNCAGCHEKYIEGGQCNHCHLYMNRYTTKPKQTVPHDRNFFARHGIKAAGSEDLCFQCHDQSYCVDCHASTMTVRPSVRYPERNDRVFMHRGDWVTRHGLEIRAADISCVKCHGRTFCSTCHR